LRPFRHRRRKAGGDFDHCVQHRLHIGGRAADDLEHVAGRGLVFERFFEVARARLQFTEQPRVLHRDHRLRREVLDEPDFLVAERPNFKPDSRDQPEQRIVFAQRHKKTCPCAVRIADFGQIGNVD
jgi:hypothetical protein